MENKRYKPLVDKLFYIITIPTVVFLAAMTVISAFDPLSLLVTIPTDVFTLYFLVSPLFGYVELREESLFIKYGFILKREIPYAKIRGTVKERSFIAESMLSLKNSFDHVRIKYNTFDVTIVSVVGNDEFVSELENRRHK